MRSRISQYSSMNASGGFMVSNPPPTVTELKSEASFKFRQWLSLLKIE
jgi:hypothetical protein